MKNESIEINLSGKYNLTNIDGMTIHTLLTARPMLRECMRKSE